jgi:hypothetical protein
VHASARLDEWSVTGSVTGSVTVGLDVKSAVPASGAESDGRGTMETMIRPTPHQFHQLLAQMAPHGDTVRISVLASELQDRYGCSRATAYRAISDALAAEAIGRSRT